MAAPKKTKRPGANAPGRCKVNIVLPHEQDLMLGVLAAKLKVSKSAVVSDALKPVLQGWYVSRRGSGPDSEPSAAPSVVEPQAA